MDTNFTDFAQYKPMDYESPLEHNVCTCGTKMNVANAIPSSDMIILVCPSCGKTKAAVDHILMEEFKSKPIVKRYEVKPVEEYIYCSICMGQFEIQSEVLTTYPPQYKYVCKGCGNIITSTEVYPKITYVRTGNIL